MHSPATNQTNLNAELLSTEARSRKHIPMAVFAVVVIHVVLFLVLLVAAGCRAKARAKEKIALTASIAGQGAGPDVAVGAPAGDARAENDFQGTEPVIAREPVLERERVSAPGPQQTDQRASPLRPRADLALAAEVRIYVVRPGDTVGKIAKEQGVTVRTLRSENRLKNDLIHPGQKLRVSIQNQPRRKAVSNEV